MRDRGEEGGQGGGGEEEEWGESSCGRGNGRGRWKRENGIEGENTGEATNKYREDLTEGTMTYTLY